MREYTYRDKFNNVIATVVCGVETVSVSLLVWDHECQDYTVTETIRYSGYTVEEALRAHLTDHLMASLPMTLDNTTNNKN